MMPNGAPSCCSVLRKVDAPVFVEFGQVAEKQDVADLFWVDRRLVGFDELVEELVSDATVSPCLIDGIEAGEPEGFYRDGESACAFSAGEAVTLCDVVVAAHEELDEEAQERCECYYLITEGEETCGVVLNYESACLLCSERDLEGRSYSMEPMSDVAVYGRVGLSGVCFAVLWEHQRTGEHMLVAALESEEDAEYVATLEHARVVHISA